MNITDRLEKRSMGYKLSPISVKDLSFMEVIPCHIWGIQNGLYEVVIKENSFNRGEAFRPFVENEQYQLFVHKDDLPKIKKIQQDNLVKLTRSLSIGNPVENGKKELELLTINMGFLYRDPTDAETLDLQFRCARNLAQFLMGHLSIHQDLYLDYVAKRFHFVYEQPMISSLFLLGALKHSHIYADKEVEVLFLTSLFKDIGMATIPQEKFEKMELDAWDKEIFDLHPENSVEILQGRCPLSPNHLKIIKNHHRFSLLKDSIKLHTQEDGEDEDSILLGFETMIVTIMDIIAAMIAGRPFREKTSLREALELTKKLIADDYPQEFKLIVHYFKQLFTTSS